jgi:diguanylate cyclase (GGDEF)-like protein/PAS domain S-box-containing protein
MKFPDIHKAILDSMGEGVYVVDRDLIILYANPASVKLTGYTAEESVGRQCYHIFCEQSSRCKDICPPKLAMREKRPILHKEAETRTKGGEIKLTQISFSPFYESGAGACRGAVIVINDITVLRKAEENVKQQNIFLNTVIDAIPNPFYVIDPNNYRVIMANKAACPGGLPEGTTCHVLTHHRAVPCSSDDHPCPVNQVRLTRRPVTIEHIHCDASGECQDVEVHAFPVFNSDNEIVQIIEYCVDISERKLEEKRLQELAYYDQLTGIPNRTLLYDRINRAIMTAKREKGKLALLYLDLDRFKSINDQFGHEAGNIVLKEAALRILACLRESDIVGRIGGDEFAVLLPKIASKRGSIAIAERIIGALSQPFQCAGAECRIGASIGISLYPVDGDTVDVLFEKADAAMYLAKDEGATSYRFWE